MTGKELPPGGKPQRSFGDELRCERELRQITLREVAEATKINLRFLEALENNDFDVLPGGIFTRGFIKSYARHIGLNEEAMINAFLMELKQQQQRAEPEPPDLLGPPGGPPSPPRGAGRSVRSITAAASLLAFFGLAFLLWTGVRHMGEEAAASRSRKPPQETGVAAPEPASVQSGTDLPVNASDPVPEQLLPAPAPERPAPPERLEVSLTFQDRTWVRVLCDDQETINRTLEAGTFRRFTCLEEVSLSTTDARAVKVEINGTTLELPGGPGDRVLPYVVRREEWPPARLDGLEANP
ncbi:MAG: RodZ domain-containing protein [Acidobacteriota bacterium]